MEGLEQPKHRVLTNAGSCTGQEADTCAAESWAVWVLSLKLQLPGSGEHIISTRLGFCLVIVLLKSQELCIVSVYVPNLNSGQ